MYQAIECDDRNTRKTTTTTTIQWFDEKKNNQIETEPGEETKKKWRENITPTCKHTEHMQAVRTTTKHYMCKRCNNKRPRDCNDDRS